MLLSGTQYKSDCAGILRGSEMGKSATDDHVDEHLTSDCA
jgi:hypothetical protein